MMAKLHGLDYESIIKALDKVGAPTNAYAIGVSIKEVVKALVLAKSIRPERYTILNKINIDEEFALSLAKSTGIV